MKVTSNDEICEVCNAWSPVLISKLERRSADLSTSQKLKAFGRVQE